MSSNTQPVLSSSTDSLGRPLLPTIPLTKEFLATLGTSDEKAIYALKPVFATRCERLSSTNKLLERAVLVSQTGTVYVIDTTQNGRISRKIELGERRDAVGQQITVEADREKDPVAHTQGVRITVENASSSSAQSGASDDSVLEDLCLVFHCQRAAVAVSFVKMLQHFAAIKGLRNGFAIKLPSGDEPIVESARRRRGNLTVLANQFASIRKSSVFSSPEQRSNSIIAVGKQEKSEVERRGERIEVPPPAVVPTIEEERWAKQKRMEEEESRKRNMAALERDEAQRRLTIVDDAAAALEQLAERRRDDHNLVLEKEILRRSLAAAAAAAHASTAYAAVSPSGSQNPSASPEVVTNASQQPPQEQFIPMSAASPLPVPAPVAAPLAAVAVATHQQPQQPFVASTVYDSDEETVAVARRKSVGPDSANALHNHRNAIDVSVDNERSYVFEQHAAPVFAASVPAATDAVVAASTPAPITASSHSQAPPTPTLHTSGAESVRDQGPAQQPPYHMPQNQLQRDTEQSTVAQTPPPVDHAAPTKLSAILQKFKKHPESAPVDEVADTHPDTASAASHERPPSATHPTDPGAEEEATEEDQFLNALSPKEAQEVVAGIIQSIERLKDEQARLLVEREMAHRTYRELTSITLGPEHGIALARLIWNICDAKLVHHFS